MLQYSCKVFRYKQAWCSKIIYNLGLIFFSVSIFFHGHWQLTGQKGKGGVIFYSTLPLPPVQEHSVIYLQLCTWDDYHTFLIARLVFTKLLLGEIYHLMELLCDWFMMWYVMKIFVCLLVELILGFITTIWHEKPVNSSSHQLSSLIYKRTD